MNKLFATALALGLGCMLAPTADARDDDWRRGHDRFQNDRFDRHDRYDRDRRYDRYDGAKHWTGDRYRDGWRHDRRYVVDPTWRYDRYHRDGYRYRAPVRYVPPRGYYSYRWDVGYRLPSSYYARPYYIDHHAYRLSSPPYGYRWVRVDDDVFLVALTTGLITHAIHDLFYH